ncbi:MAG TPA: M28 family peptidase [Longimicrobiales bacterium]|nr:M28 family peptidase [Longimicrobiales bacterium]
MERTGGGTAEAGDARRSAAGLVAALARPRMAGSEGAEQVAAELRGRLEGLGYEVRELPFSFSTLPGRFGVPVLGAVLLATAVAATAFNIVDVHWLALVITLVGGGLAFGGAYLWRRLLRVPFQRLECANWLVTRPGARPRYLVSAHRDSKSQPVSIRVRAAGVAAALIGWAALLIVSIAATLVGNLAAWVAIVVGAVLALGSLAMLLSWSANHSPGALDNATGLAALVGLAERLSGEDGVGFLVTDGEELGLAGAFAAAPALPRVAGIINLDGLADEGPLQVIERHGFPRKGRAAHLAAALLTAADEAGVGARRRDLPPGIVVEHVAYTRYGIPSLTLMHGTPSALSRVHRPSDTAERVTGDGVAATVTVVEEALRRLLRTDAPASSAPLLGHRAPGDPSTAFPRLDVESRPLLGPKGGDGA